MIIWIYNLLCCLNENMFNPIIYQKQTHCLLSKYSIHCVYLVSTAVLGFLFLWSMAIRGSVWVCAWLLTTVVVACCVCTSSRTRIMGFPNLLLVWSLSHDLYTSGGAHYNQEVRKCCTFCCKMWKSVVYFS